MKFQLFMIIIKIYYIYLSRIITFPFERNISFKLNDEDNFYDKYFYNKIYTKIYIGFPNKEIYLQIKSKQYSFCIRNDSVYNCNNSLTYKKNDIKDTDIFNVDYRYSTKSNETFIFGNENITIEDLKFMLTKESKYDYDGILGLQILENNEKVWGYNLIPQLKNKKIIDKECFFYIFNKNSDNGNLIVGEYPHLIDKYKDLYYEEQFQVTSVFIPSYEQNFDFKFRSVFWNNTEVESLSVGQIQIDSGIIIGSMKFCDISWEFFAPHFIKKKCSRVDVNVLYQAYICEDYEVLLNFQV